MSRRRIRLHPMAEADLEEARAYSHERWGREQTRRYFAALRRAMDALKTFPAMGRVASRDGELRALQHGKHLVVYRAAGDTIDVVRVVHVARDLEPLLRVFTEARYRTAPGESEGSGEP